MPFDPLLGDYSEVFLKIFYYFAFENMMYPYDNRKKIRAKKLLDAANAEYSKTE